jgi:Dehydrogenases with different specificities (related to short-chain alcohol dehydrogenases)
MSGVLQGRVAVVTGGARGLGLTAAEALAGAGAEVALVDVLDVAPAAAGLSERTGRRCVGVKADVTDEASVAAALDRVAGELGLPTVLVNSAGISLGASALDTTLADWQRIFDVNVTGTFLAAREFARRLVAAGSTGSVVNIASMSGQIVNVPQTQAAYNASKAAVSMLTKSLAVEWLPYGIRVNAISPGYFATDMTKDFAEQNPELTATWIERTPIGRMGRPEELAELFVYLASDRSSYLVGHDVVIDGGYTLV